MFWTVDCSCSPVTKALRSPKAAGAACAGSTGAAWAGAKIGAFGGSGWAAGILDAAGSAGVEVAGVLEAAALVEAAGALG